MSDDDRPEMTGDAVPLPERRPWSPTVPRTVLATICHMLGVDPDRVSRISIYPDSIEIVDERSVAGRLDGRP